MVEADLYQKPKLITVFGGSGFVGRYVAEILTQRGYRVRIAVRYPDKAYYMKQIGNVGQMEMLRADVGCKADIGRALDGAYAAVYLPGALFSQGKNSLRKLHINGAAAVAEQAAANKIKLIHISCLSVGNGRKSAYLRTKIQGEKRVRSAHKKAVILRPSVIFGAEDYFFNRFAGWTRFTRALPLVGGGRAKLQPVYVGDVAEMVARAVENKAAQGKIYELGGCEVMSFRAALEKMLHIIRRRRSFMNVPLPLALIWAGLWGLFGKIPFMPKVITADQVRLFRYDSVVSHSAIQEKRTLEGAGIIPQAPDAVLPRYLWRFRPHGQFSRPVAGC